MQSHYSTGSKSFHPVSGLWNQCIPGLLYEAALGQLWLTERGEQVPSLSALSFHPPPLALCSPCLFHSNSCPLPRPPSRKVPHPITQTQDLYFCRPRSSCPDPVPFFILCSFLSTSWLLGSPTHLSPFQPCASRLFPSPRVSGTRSPDRTKDLRSLPSRLSPWGRPYCRLDPE